MSPFCKEAATSKVRRPHAARNREGVNPRPAKPRRAEGEDTGQGAGVEEKAGDSPDRQGFDSAMVRWETVGW